MNKTKILKISSVVIALVVWELAALSVSNDMLLASPLNVISRLFSVFKESDFLSTVLFSYIRITEGFLIAFVLGFCFGVLAGKFYIVEILLYPYVITIKSVPVASFIILFLIWMDFTKLTVLISVLIAFPIIYSNVLAGMKSTDKKMLEMSKVYNLNLIKEFLYIHLPSIKPYLISSSGTCVGMAWKAGVAAEIIGLIDGSIGEKLYNAKIYFQNADLLCWTLLIIILSILSEKVFVFLLKSVFGAVEKI